HVVPDGKRYGDNRRQRLRRQDRHADLRPRRDDEGDHYRGQGRRQEGGRRDVLPGPVRQQQQLAVHQEPRRRHDSERRLIARTQIAAGGVLTAQQAPHRPGTVAVAFSVTSTEGDQAERESHSGAVVPLLLEYYASEGSILASQNRKGQAVKLGVIPENLAERLALWFGIPPPGIVESWLGIMASRAVMAATKLDIFET